MVSCRDIRDKHHSMCPGLLFPLTRGVGLPWAMVPVATMSWFLNFKTHSHLDDRCPTLPTHLPVTRGCPSPRWMSLAHIWVSRPCGGGPSAWLPWTSPRWMLGEGTLRSSRDNCHPQEGYGCWREAGKGLPWLWDSNSHYLQVKRTQKEKREKKKGNQKFDGTS